MTTVNDERSNAGPIEIVRAALSAFFAGDVPSLRQYVDPDLAWTYLDPSQASPVPQTCYGRKELERGIGRWASMGLTTSIEEVEAFGNKVIVITHTPGLDGFRERQAQDRNFFVVTVTDGHITALRACLDRAQARSLAQLEEGN